MEDEYSEGYTVGMVDKENNEDYNDFPPTYIVNVQAWKDGYRAGYEKATGGYGYS